MLLLPDAMLEARGIGLGRVTKRRGHSSQIFHTIWRTNHKLPPASRLNSLLFEVIFMDLNFYPSISMSFKKLFDKLQTLSEQTVSIALWSEISTVSSLTLRGAGETIQNFSPPRPLGWGRRWLKFHTIVFVHCTRFELQNICLSRK